MLAEERKQKTDQLIDFSGFNRRNCNGQIPCDGDRFYHSGCGDGAVPVILSAGTVPMGESYTVLLAIICLV
ncbi:MAG: hypothetical protein ACLURV_11550 [Gallintestinimicrobium sp.]